MFTNEDALRSEILNIVNQPNYQPQKPKRLLTLLGLDSDHASLLRSLIRKMANEGLIAYGRNHFVHPITGTETKQNAQKVSALKRDDRIIFGRFQRRPSGSGIVRARSADDDDFVGNEIFIPPHWTNDAASGDTVAVEIRERKPKDDYGKNTKGKKKFSDSQEEPGPQGKIIKIIDRVTNRFVGTYNVRHGRGYVKIDGSSIKEFIALGDVSATTAQPDDKIVVEMIRYPSQNVEGEAVIVEVLGAHGVPGLDTLLVFRQYDLPEQFSRAALEAAGNEVEKFFKLISDESGSESDIAEAIASAERHDLTHETIITIDPADAKDFDDALSLEKLENGNWRLGVHIADVAHFVPLNSPIDKEAAGRATSIYLPDRVIPMLPEVLSNALASLQPDKIRFAKSVYMELTPMGVRTHTEIFRSAIKSRQRFNYDEVQDFFEHPNKYRKWKPEIRKLLSHLLELMRILRQCRFDRGSLEMDIPETKIDLDQDGRVVGAHVYPYYDSNRVVEECMLAANEAVAEMLAAKAIPFLRRIHSGPSPRKLQAFADFIKSLDIAELDADEMYQDRFIIQRLLQSVKGTAQEYAVNFSLLRSMQKAIYSPDTEGHYALASKCYGHFTSPIRRYPDLTLHRLLDDILHGKEPKPDLRELIMLGEHCSDREQRAENAERELIKLKLVDYTSRHIGEEIEAVVTSAERFGVFVRGLEIPVEGLIRLEALGYDYYHFDQHAKILIGNLEGNTFRIGDRLVIEATQADMDTRQIDFRLVRRLKMNKKTARLKKIPVRRVKKKVAKQTKKKSVVKK